MSTAPPPTGPGSPGEITIDREKYPLAAATSLGYLGTRWLAARDPRRYLVRNVSWVVGTRTEHPLRPLDRVFRTPPAGEKWFRPVRRVDGSIRRPGGAEPELMSVYVQEVGGLTPFTEKLAEAAAAGRVPEVHRLFAAAAASLGAYQAAVDPELIPDAAESATDLPPPGPPVLCPAGLAVAPDGTVVLLDAGLTFQHHPQLVDLEPPELGKYLPAKYRVGMIPGMRTRADELSALHAVGLMQAFLGLQQRTDWRPGVRKQLDGTVEKVKALTEELRKQGQLMGVEGVQKLFTARAPETENVTDEPPPPPPVAAPPKPPVVVAPKPPESPPRKPEPIVVAPLPEPEPEPEPRKKEHAVWKVLTGVFALIAVILAVVLMTRGPRTTETAGATKKSDETKPGPGGDPGKKDGKDVPPGPVTPGPTPPVIPGVTVVAGGAPVPRSYVLFVGDNNNLLEVRKQVEDEIADVKVETYPRRGPEERAKLVDAQLKKLVAGLPDGKEVHDALDRLHKAGVRFRGFNPADQKSLAAVVANQGVFNYPRPEAKGSDPKLPAADNQASGGLLQPTGPEDALKAAKLADDKGAGDRLTALQRVVVDYAGYKDLVTLIGDSKALVVTPTGELTAEQAGQLHQKLIKSRTDTRTVFAPRPGLGLYADVDYKLGDATPPGSYTLTIPARAYWRQVGTKDRLGADLAAASDPDRVKMKWKEFAPSQRIVWQQVTLDLTAPGGGERAATSFDVAVPVDESRVVVVFRNQKIQMDAKEATVKTRVERYLRTELKVPEANLAESWVPSQTGEQHVGTIQYSALAALLAGSTPGKGSDVLVLPATDFDALTARENGASP